MKTCKKGFAVFLIIFLYFISSTMALANSGPTYWRGYPSAEILAVDENCPVEVAREDLTFDLSGNYKNSYTIGGNVKAAYEMLNPTNKDLTVQMAFPIVSSLNDFSPDDIAVTVDGTSLPFDLYIGDVADSGGSSFQKGGGESLVFKDILSAVTNQTYQAKHFSENETGKLYILQVNPAAEQKINLAIDFELDKEKSRVLTKGFNRYERKNKSVRIAAWCYEPETLEIFVLGDDIDFNITGYTDGELKQKTDLFTYEISSKQAELKPYLMEYMKNYRQAQNIPESEIFDEVQLYNQYSAALDSMLAGGEGFAACEDLISQHQYNRVITLLYEVDFPANSNKNVTVSYKITGTMDRTKTSKPVYTFQYILNPAQNWNRFGALDIEIATPEENPYIVDSSIEMTKESDRHYTASLDSLPEKDLTFSLYEQEKISPLENFAPIRYINRYFPAAGTVIIIAAAALAGVALFSGRLRKKK